MLMGTDKYKVDEMELHEIPTPEATRTHHPVPHGVFASEVERVIAHNGFSINRKEYAIFRDGMRACSLMSRCSFFSISSTQSHELPSDSRVSDLWRSDNPAKKSS